MNLCYKDLGELKGHDHASLTPSVSMYPIDFFELSHCFLYFSMPGLGCFKPNVFPSTSQGKEMTNLHKLPHTHMLTSDSSYAYPSDVIVDNKSTMQHDRIPIE